MMRSIPVSRAPHRTWGAPCFSLIAASLLLTIGFSAAGAAGAHQHHASMPMTEAAMEKWVANWFAAHPMRGAASTGVPVATFNAVGFRFDLDNNPATLVDTAKIMVGETVQWHRVDGSHTTTNGLSSKAPDAGLLFDQPLTAAAPNFTFTFNTAGEYHFFCRPHEGDVMKGVVLVSTLVGVDPTRGARIGFTSGPHPNPSRTSVSFGFALVQAGRVTAELFDARGRRVATAVDRNFGPGEQSASWDGRVQGGAKASAGVYYLRLRLPGYTATRQVSITR